MSQLSLKKIKLGDNADTSKNFLIKTPAVADGTLTIEREDGTDILSIAADGAVSLSGTTTNSNAAAGVIGEILTSTALFSSSCTSGTVGVATQITLPAGDWEAQGIINFGATSATLTKVSTALHTSAAMPSWETSLQLGGVAFSSAATGSLKVPTPVTRFSLAAPTAINLVHFSYFNAGSVSIIGGEIRARRVR